MQNKKVSVDRSSSNKKTVNILFIGDIFGSPGRNILARHLPGLIEKHGVKLVIGNGENAAGGFGITPKIADELFRLGVHVITTGNHAWDKREIMEYFPHESKLLRPANYPQTAPGQGSTVVDLGENGSVGVLQLMGRVYMPVLDCPFQVSRRELELLRSLTSIIIVDMHAEATSEKRAMGWYLDGKVTAVIGTHTHVQTADEDILSGGTAYLTDVGMTGPYESVIGVRKEMAIKKFMDHMPARFEVAGGPSMISAVLIGADRDSGKAISIQRLQIKESGG